jgi:hypothetical protein
MIVLLVVKDALFFCNTMGKSYMFLLSVQRNFSLLHEAKEHENDVATK